MTNNSLCCCVQLEGKLRKLFRWEDNIEMGLQEVGLVGVHWIYLA